MKAETRAALRKAFKNQGKNIPTGKESTGDALLDTIVDRIMPSLSEAIVEAATVAVATLGENRALIEVKRADGPTVSVGRQHKAFPTVLKIIAAGDNVLLYGPAGSFKSTIARECARGLALAFRAQSFNLHTSKTDVFGFKDAAGNLHRTAFRDICEFGGVFLADEFDKCNPGVAASLNYAIDAPAGAGIEFPDGPVPKHAQCVVVACQNTVGTGATTEYVDALDMGAEKRDRFAFLYVEYDEDLERDIAVQMSPELGAEWCKRVQRLRAAASALAIRHVISPRATLRGIRLLAQGIDADAVEEMAVWKGLDADQRERIKTQAKDGAV